MVVERGDLLGRREDELGHDRSDPQMTILKCTINRRRHSGWIDLLITVEILHGLLLHIFINRMSIHDLAPIHINIHLHGKPSEK